MREQIVDAIVRERIYQDSKWGTIEENPHTLGEWLNIMHQELSEADYALSMAGFSWGNKMDSDVLCEILQVISVGFACLEQHGIVERDKPALQAAETERGQP
jgi:hypothetical protein